MAEIEREDIDILREDIKKAETIEELQTSVLLANEMFAEEEESEVELAGVEDKLNKVEGVIEWMSLLRSKLEDLTDANEITSYSISLSGSLTGPSISLTVTGELN